jgi:class 3 adenylate cyclase
MTTDPENPNLNVAPEVKTLLATDLVSSTKFIEQLGDDLAAEIFAEHDRLIRDLAVKHNGQEIDKTDGFLFLFARPTDAVKFAILYHDALRKLSSERGQDLSSRIGIHLGEVILRKNSSEDISRGAKPLEVEGLSKHLVARVMSLATSHQTLLTAPPFQLARRAQTAQSPYPADTAWLKHGYYLFKGIEEAIMIYEVGRRNFAPLIAPTDSQKARRVRGRSVSTYDAGDPKEPRASKARLYAALSVAAAVLILLVWSLRPEADASDPIFAPISNKPTSIQAAPNKTKSVSARPVVKAEEKLRSRFVLHLVSRPAGALFEVKDGAVLGTAPTTLDLPAKENQFRLKASLSGHKSADIICVITAADLARKSGVCTAELQKQAPARSPTKKAPATQELDGYKDNPFDDE